MKLILKFVLAALLFLSLLDIFFANERIKTRRFKRKAPNNNHTNSSNSTNGTVPGNISNSTKKPLPPIPQPNKPGNTSSQTNQNPQPKNSSTPSNSTSGNATSNNSAINETEMAEKLKNIPTQFHKFFQGINPSRFVTSPPYRINSCNDYIFIPCQWIKDSSLKDIIPRVECFLNINFVNIAVYNISHPDFLFEFLSTDRAKFPAIPVRGDPRCITIDNVDMVRPISICVNSKSEAEQLIESINMFGDCHFNARSRSRNNCPDLTKKLMIMQRRNITITAIQANRAKRSKKSLFNSRAVVLRSWN